MNKAKTVVLCILAFGFAVSSRGQLVINSEKVLVVPNATSHIFQMPVQQLQDTVIALFRYFPFMDDSILHQVFRHYDSLEGYRLSTYFLPKTAKKADSFYGGRYFDMPGTENDIFLLNNGPWDSPLYYLNGRPLAYTTPFVLKLKSADNNHTRLTVEALRPSVYIGFAIWGILDCNCGIFPGPATKTVQATTIEEHALLLFIAGNLGDKSVEPLKMPERLQNVIAHNSIMPL